MPVTREQPPRAKGGTICPSLPGSFAKAHTSRDENTTCPSALEHPDRVCPATPRTFFPKLAGSPRSAASGSPAAEGPPAGQRSLTWWRDAARAWGRAWGAGRQAPPRARRGAQRRQLCAGEGAEPGAGGARQARSSCGGPLRFLGREDASLNGKASLGANS